MRDFSLLRFIEIPIPDSLIDVFERFVMQFSIIIIVIAFILASCAANVPSEINLKCLSEKNLKTITIVDFAGENLKIFVNNIKCIDKIYSASPQDSSGFSGFINLEFKAGDKLLIIFNNADRHEFIIDDDTNFLTIIKNTQRSSIEILPQKEYYPLD